MEKKLTPKQKLALKKRTIKALNLKFEKADKANKRIIIAEDVILQLKSKRFVARKSLYICPKVFKNDDWSHGEITDAIVKHKDKSLQDVILTEKCNVCALGGAFASVIRINNNYILNDNNISNINGDYVQVEMYRILKKYFSIKQLQLIEVAFELGVGCIRKNNTTEMECAIFWGEQYINPNKRLIAIMKNIIENKGTFNIWKRN